jgi:hypothetical protein
MALFQLETATEQTERHKPPDIDQTPAKVVKKEVKNYVL